MMKHNKCLIKTPLVNILIIKIEVCIKFNSVLHYLVDITYQCRVKSMAIFKNKIIVDSLCVHVYAY